tara:strand:+ start:150 stop:401 length:252 start_codon:yes stop_codon:yes gene_type:complete
MFAFLGFIACVALLGYIVFNRGGRSIAGGCLKYFFLGIYAILCFLAIFALFSDDEEEVLYSLFILSPLIIYLIYVYFVKDKGS